MDKVVAAVPFRDMIFIFTERGYVFKMSYSDLTKEAKVEAVSGINLAVPRV